MNKFDTSEYKVTYLLGAGASAEALPTVKGNNGDDGLSYKFQVMANELKTNKLISDIHRDFSNELSANLLWLADGSNKFATTDTYAKFLYLQDRNSLVKLKKTLSLYFTIEQFINHKIDKRTLTFLTTIMQLNNIFPTNIKILNWNYDFQIQLAAEVFRKEEFHPGTVYFHSPPLIGYYPTLGSEFFTNSNIDNNAISMVHLNGIAGFYFLENENTILNLFLNKRPKDINEIFEKVKTHSDRKYDLLTFAWEKDTKSSNILRARIKYAKSIINETDILVIIGYSFPFFNRDIDKEIFKTLNESGKLKKIFYQDPYRTGAFLKNQFELSDEVKIEHIEYKDNYYVPIEL